VRVVILCDVDPDGTAYGGPGYDTRGPLKWEGLAHGIPLLVERLSEIEQATGRKINITWCVRSDLQMQEIYGDAAWPYRAFRDMWEEIEKRGDEIAWHPHLWRWSDEHRCWYQETRDEEWIEECLTTGYRALCEATGRRIRVSRMGWEFHNEFTIRVLDGIGVEKDFSAVPEYRSEGDSSDGTIFHKRADWRGTPMHPYHPSKVDYRRPKLDGEDELQILEIPLWNYVAAFWRVLGKTYGMLKWAAKKHSLPFGASRKEVFFHTPAFTMPPMIFVPSLHAARRRLHGPAVFAFHCDELLEGAGVKKLIYSLANAEANAMTIATSAGGAMPASMCDPTLMIKTETLGAAQGRPRSVFRAEERR